jgi:ribosomal protein S18 acetylase RimI-like enzyme
MPSPQVQFTIDSRTSTVDASAAATGSDETQLRHEESTVAMWLAWRPVTFARAGEHGTIDGVSVLVRAVTNVDGVLAATALFDMPPTAAGAAAFVDAPGHHLLVAEVDGVPAGFGTAIEMRHPDKGLEVFLYELGVDERYRRQGVASALLAALDDLAVRLGATGCWTATEPHNTAALATYAQHGATREDVTLLAWDLVVGRVEPDRPSS